jgi:hypothetical protein
MHSVNDEPNLKWGLDKKLQKERDRSIKDRSLEMRYLSSRYHGT